MRRSLDMSFGSLPSYKYGINPYDSTKLGLGQLMTQQSSYVGPMPSGLVRPMEYSTAIPGIFPWAMQWLSSLDWFFLSDGASAAVTRRVLMGTLERSTGSMNLSGYITITFPTATAHTIRGFRMTYDKHTDGTVGVVGSAVTGTDTTWQTDGACVGNRIGFGSTDPTEITAWYEISTITSDSAIVLTESVPTTIPPGTAYVIEDLRAVVETTNATPTNGGLFLVKGLRPEVFHPSGTTIPAATTVDSIRACYWLKDAAVETNTVGFGLAIEPVTSKASHICWVLNTTTNPVLYKYNLRAPLTGLVAGATTSAFLFKTGSGGLLTGTASQTNNGRYAVANHGPGAGVGCIYFTTTNRIYRTIDTSLILSNSTTFISDNMVEIPPGGTATFASSSLMNSIEYMSLIDRFVIAVNATSIPYRDYLSSYKTDSSPIERVTFADIRQLFQSTSDMSVQPVPSKNGVAFSYWCEGGVAYIAQIGTVATTNLVWALPIGADWEYTSLSQAFIITPSMSVPLVDKLIKALAVHVQVNSGDTIRNLGMQNEPYRIWYRVSGISDDSGTWIALDSTGSLSGITSSIIQFKLEFRCIGLTFLPSRITSLVLIYDDISTDSHYQFSVGLSDKVNKQFSWRHSTAFGASVPPIHIRIYDAVTNGLLVDDNTSTPTGTFERSTDNGLNWVPWTNADKANENTYVRYTPASLADNIKVAAVLTLV